MLRGGNKQRRFACKPLSQPLCQVRAVRRISDLCLGLFSPDLRPKDSLDWQDMRGSLSKLMSNRRTSNAATTPQGTPLAYPSCWANCRFLGRPNSSENPSPASSFGFKVCQFFFSRSQLFYFCLLPLLRLCNPFSTCCC